MREVLQALNHLVVKQVIKDYAIGGAVGAAFYIEAVRTEDVDAFVFLPSNESTLASLTPIYNELKLLGGIEEREYIRFGDWPLQILTDANPLIAEAIREAKSVDYDGIPTRVFRPEHLCAVALQTGRSKDYLRVRMFLEDGAVDKSSLSAVLSRFGLEEKMKRLLSLDIDQGRRLDDGN
jgi:hypothetical protein